ncbi:MAG: DUF1697 domain-containing protein, partial [Rhodoplanes sp.]
MPGSGPWAGAARANASIVCDRTIRRRRWCRRSRAFRAGRRFAPSAGYGSSIRGSGMAVFVALLRGVNVGKHNRVKMADLRAALESAGHTGVSTHIQSGNIVLTSTAR